MDFQVYGKIETMNEFPEDPFWPEETQTADDTFFTTTTAEPCDFQEKTVSDQHQSSFYTPILQVGAGAMGEVFLARDRNLLRRVAYKKLHTQARIDAEALVRFVREVQITAQLEHPNVIPVYHLEKTDTGWAYAMKLVFGQTLKALIQEAKTAIEKGQPPNENVRQRALISYFVEVCEAMAYAHEQGIIHRDLKPANIMVGPHREVYVMDWGIARRIENTPSDQGVQFQDLPDLMQQAEGDFEQTQTGKILGTPRYLSPEQATGHNHKLDGRSDQFTLGLILQEILTLSPAYQATDMQSLLKKVLRAEREPLTSNNQIPRELVAIVRKATQRKRDARYENLKAMIADLRRYLRGDAVQAEPDRWFQRIMRWAKKNPLRTASFVVVLCVILGLLVTSALYRQSTQTRRLKQQQQQLVHLQNQVSHQAHLINNHFLDLESRLKAFNATLASNLSANRTPERLFFEQDYFKAPPGDSHYDVRYAKVVSHDQGVLIPQVLAPNPNHLHALSHLNETLKQLFQKADLTWAHALFKDVYFSYPGKSGYPTDYEPRETAWAQATRQSQGNPVWSRPYIDAQGQGIMLSVAMPVEPGSQTSNSGITALSISLPYLIDHFMTLKDLPVEQSYLLNGKGEIMVNARDGQRMSGMHYGMSTRRAVLDTPLFDVPELVEAIRQKKSGYFRYFKDARAKQLAYYPLNSLGWYYVVEVDEDKLFALTR